MGKSMAIKAEFLGKTVKFSDPTVYGQMLASILWKKVIFVIWSDVSMATKWFSEFYCNHGSILKNLCGRIQNICESLCTFWSRKCC